jgi:hypothetical protein
MRYTNGFTDRGKFFSMKMPSILCVNFYIDEVVVSKHGRTKGKTWCVAEGAKPGIDPGFISGMLQLLFIGFLFLLTGFFFLGTQRRLFLGFFL